MIFFKATVRTTKRFFLTRDSFAFLHLSSQAVQEKDNERDIVILTATSLFPLSFTPLYPGSRAVMQLMVHESICKEGEGCEGRQTLRRIKKPNSFADLKNAATSNKRKKKCAFQPKKKGRARKKRSGKEKIERLICLFLLSHSNTLLKQKH